MDDVGKRLSAIDPGSVRDGRLAWMCHCATHDLSFTSMRQLPDRAELIKINFNVHEGRVVLTQRLVDVAVGASDLVPHAAGPLTPDAGSPLASLAAVMVPEQIVPRAEGHGWLNNTADRFRSLVDEAPLGIAVLTLEGRVLEVNRSLCRLLERPDEALVGLLMNSFAHPDEGTLRVDRSMLRREGHTRMEKRYLTGSGATVWLRVSTSLIEEQGESRLLSMFEDITDLVRSRNELHRRSTHDPLTGLWNRESLRGQLRRSIESVRAGQTPAVTLLFIDLDRFKVVNDSLGHDAGDRLLIEIAGRFEDALPPSARLFRMGGDEFAAIVRGGTGSAVASSQSLRKALEAPIGLGGREVSVGISIGVSLADASTLTVLGPLPEDSLIRDADTALFSAKTGGRDRVVLFDDAMRENAVARLDDEQDLRWALRRGELRIAVQPIHRSDNGQVAEHEALVRWEHPTRGLLAPASFLDVADEVGLLADMGRTVLDLCCAQLVSWRRTRPEARMAVNVAAAHLLEGTLAFDVRSALSRYGLPAQALTLEITEQTLVHAHAWVSGELQGLREDGCRIALDDFGTGYSSLAYLRRLPVDILKVDRVFTTGLGTPANDGALFRAIIALGSGLGLETVVEGVETREELAEAVAAGADYIQGFLLGRPEPVPALPTV